MELKLAKCFTWLEAGKERDDTRRIIGNKSVFTG